MSSAADALAAEGAPITLHHRTDGPTVVALRYTFASLREIESDFGSLADLMTAVTGAASSMDVAFKVAAGTATPEEVAQHEAAPKGDGLFNVVVRALAPGLLDVPWTDRSGETIWLGEDHDELSRVMVFAEFANYLAAFSDAFGQSFKDMHGVKGDGAKVPPTAATSRSRGPRGGTSSSGSPASRKKSSGA